MSRGMRDYEYPLTAGVWKRIDTDGNYFQVLVATGDIELKFDDTITVKRAAPTGSPVVAFRKVEILSPIDQTVRIALGTAVEGAPPYDGRTIITQLVSILMRVPDGVAGLDDLVLTTGSSGSFAANANRDTLIITLDEAAPDYVIVGNNVLNKAARLYPGGSFSVRAKGIVHVRNPNAVTVTVSASETVYVP